MIDDDLRSALEDASHPRRTGLDRAGPRVGCRSVDDLGVTTGSDMVPDPESLGPRCIKGSRSQACLLCALTTRLGRHNL